VRTKTYVSFYANCSTEPVEMDAKYHRLITAWRIRRAEELTYVSRYEKELAKKDINQRAIVRTDLVSRMYMASQLLLVIGITTCEDEEWLPMEIRQAVDKMKIPIIAAYTMTDEPIRNPYELSDYWPYALMTRIRDNSANVIHIPFKKKPVRAALQQFDYERLPRGRGLSCYSEDAYRAFGMPCNPVLAPARPRNKTGLVLIR